ATAGACGVGAVAEAVEHGLRPPSARLAQLVHQAATVTRAGSTETTGDGCSIQISLSIQRHAAVGILSGTKAVEAEDHALRVLSCAGWSQLDHGRAAVDATGYGRAVGVAGIVEDQLRSGISTICAAGEAVDHMFGGRPATAHQQNGNGKE